MSQWTEAEPITHHIAAGEPVLSPVEGTIVNIAPSEKIPVTSFGMAIRATNPPMSIWIKPIDTIVDRGTAFMRIELPHEEGIRVEEGDTVLPETPLFVADGAGTYIIRETRGPVREQPTPTEEHEMADATGLEALGITLVPLGEEKSVHVAPEVDPTQATGWDALKKPLDGLADAMKKHAAKTGHLAPETGWDRFPKSLSELSSMIEAYTLGETAETTTRLSTTPPTDQELIEACGGQETLTKIAKGTDVTVTEIATQRYYANNEQLDGCDQDRLPAK